MRSNTWFENLEDLLRKVDADASNDTGFIAVPLIKKAMIEDQHQLFHDAEWADGCPICDAERATEMTDDTPTLSPTTLICVRCLKKWTPPHSCDVAYGDIRVKVVRTEDYEGDSEYDSEDEAQPNED